MQWYWKNNSTWEPYAEGVSAQLERAHKNQTTCILVLHDVPYKMDFQSMTQQRTDNPKRYPLRRHTIPYDTHTTHIEERTNVARALNLC
jgi:hypothetical protein